MKHFLFSVLFLVACFSLQAQEKGEIRFAGNIGFCAPNSGAGISIDLLDFRYNILDNLNVGLKMGGAFMVRDFKEINATTESATMHLNTNLMLVSDYYFHNGRSAFAPFVGAGIGSFSIYDINMKVDPTQSVNYTYNELPLPAVAIGGAIRGGFEFGRLRLAMEYYMIPRTKMYDAANIMQEIGTSANSYLAINLGFYFGGGKWRR